MYARSSFTQLNKIWLQLKYSKGFSIMKKVLFLIAVFFMGLCVFGNVAHATGLVDETVDVTQRYSQYSSDFYQLDFYVDNSWSWLPWNWLDGISNSVMWAIYAITNALWSLSVFLSKATGEIVGQAFTMDIVGDLAGKVGVNIQKMAGINYVDGYKTTGLYWGFLLILILAVGLYVTYTGVLKRETSKAISAVVQFIVIFALTSSFILYSPTYITKINDFSSDISSSLLDVSSGILGVEGEHGDSVDGIRNSLHMIQIEKPWTLLQFGSTDISTERVDAILSINPDSEDRETAVKNEIENNGNMWLSVSKVINRLTQTLFLFLFNIAISFFVILLSAMMLLSQLLFIIYATILPIVFIVSMIPTFSHLAKSAIMKLFNIVMMKAGITIIVVIAFSISNMLYSMTSTYSFFMVALLQIITFAGVWLKMNDLLSMFSLQSSDTSQFRSQLGRNSRYMFNRRRYGSASFLGGLALSRITKRGRKKNVDAGSRVASSAGAATSSAGSTASQTAATDNQRPNLGQRIGAKVGAVTDMKDRAVDAVKSVPTNIAYGATVVKDNVKGNVAGVKERVTQSANRPVVNRNSDVKDRQNVPQAESKIGGLRQNETSHTSTQGRSNVSSNIESEHSKDNTGYSKGGYSDNTNTRKNVTNNTKNNDINKKINKKMDKKTDMRFDADYTKKQLEREKANVTRKDKGGV